MRNKTVQDRYTPLDNVFMLEANGKLDHDTMREVNIQIIKLVYTTKVNSAFHVR